jgi:hypothetical protein
MARTEAEIVGTDPYSDIAVLKQQMEKFPQVNPEF